MKKVLQNVMLILFSANGGKTGGNKDMSKTKLSF